MYTQKRLSMTAAVIVLGAVVGLAQYASAASVVPNEWNVTADFKQGAYLQSFESQPSPDWIGALGELVIQDSHVNPLSPARANTWFSSNSKVLELATDDAAITNSLVPDVGSVVSFATDPVFVDMRIKFVVQSEAPTTTGAKLAIYASEATKLTVVHNGGSTAYTTADLTTTWHQLTVKMKATGKFDVLLDDASVATDLTLIGAPADDKLNSVVFSGTGFIDELYVSHGNPAYAGTMGAIPSVLVGGALDDEASVNNWLAHRIYSGLLTTGASFADFTKSQLDTAYLLNELGGTTTAAEPVTYTFGISAIDLITPTNVMVTCSLVTSGQPLGKTGTINGKIKLLYRADSSTAWSAASGVVTPSPADFTAGKATYTFTIPGDGVNKFFKPQIVP